MTDQKRRMAVCCPSAPHLSNGLCAKHYQRRKAWLSGVASSNPDEIPWLDEIVENEKIEKAKRSAEKHLKRIERANNKRTASKGYRKYTTKYRYGVSQEFIDDMKASQGGACFICGAVGVLYIDHCHTTGKVRSLLCPGCNTTVGVLESKPDIVEKARAYIEKFTFQSRKAGKDDRPT